MAEHKPRRPGQKVSEASTEIARRPTRVSEGRPSRANKSIKFPVPDRYTMFMDGTLDPADFTDDEVNKMQLMDKDGHLKGRPTKSIPRELAMAFRTQQQLRLMAWFAEEVPEAQKAYREILNSRHLQPGDAARLRAAEGIFERVIGKVSQAQDVHLTVDKGKSFEDYVGDAVIDLEDDDDEL